MEQTQSLNSDNWLANCLATEAQARYGPGEGVAYRKGPPRATRTKSQSELESLGYIGIYLTGK